MPLMLQYCTVISCKCIKKNTCTNLHTIAQSHRTHYMCYNSIQFYRAIKTPQTFVIHIQCLSIDIMSLIRCFPKMDAPEVNHFICRNNHKQYVSIRSINRLESSWWWLSDTCGSSATTPRTHGIPCDHTGKPCPSFSPYRLYTP